MTQAKKPRKDPLLTAAVLKRSLGMRGDDARVFSELYEGVLRDYALTDAQVDAYASEHADEVERLARGRIDD